MSYRKWYLLAVLFAAGFSVAAQKIVYSEPEKDDTRKMNFEIAGKIGGNYLVYKNIRNKNWIVLFDNEMQQIDKVDQDYVPDNDRMINVDFFPYNDFCYMIYQYQKHSTIYCMAVKIDGNGKKISEVMQLDTTHIGFAANNKIYTVLSSEDKGKIIVFKINSKNRKLYMVTTLLFNDRLELQMKSRLSMPMEDRDNYLNEFHLDNEGDLVFTKFFRSGSDNITQAAFIVKPAKVDSFIVRDLSIEKTYLDEIHIKVDNVNKRYFLTSFYYRQRRGNIDGFYFYVWDKQAGKAVREDTIIFSDELRREAKGDNGVKMAFDDHFIRNIIIKKDGGFIISSECFYTTSRFNNWNRWDYLYGSSIMSPLDYYNYSPYFSNYWWNSPRYVNNQGVRYHADNIAVFSFDQKGKLQWSNVIGKSQFDDESDDEVSFQLMNTGGQLHFLFNQMEKRANLLNDYTISPDGELNHNPTLKNLDRGYEFMPKYGKQISAKQIIIPCLHRTLICFAKIDYN
ncbi:MAG: hypothetical protein ACHQEB_05620 [Chitinophagales bacterium]